MIERSLNVGSWQQLPHLDIARSHSPVAVYNGKLYVFGGGGPNFQSLNSSVVYDPAIGRWEKIRDMPTKRSGTAAFTVDDKIYVLGGGFKKEDGNFQFLTTVEIYDPETDTWVTGPDLNMPHDYPAAAKLGDAIYILGGHHPDACLAGPKTDPGFDYCETLTIGESQWVNIANLPTPRFAASGLVQDGKILVAGGVAFTKEGFNNFDFIETYDPNTDTWAKDALKLPWPAAGQGMCIFKEHVFMFGGYSTDDIHDRAACYEPAQHQWSRLPPMPLPRAAMGVAVIDDTIYLVGGWADDGRTPINSVVAYTL